MAIVVGPREGTDEIWTTLVVSGGRVEPTGGGEKTVHGHAYDMYMNILYIIHTYTYVNMYIDTQLSLYHYKNSNCGNHSETHGMYLTWGR